MHYGCADIYCEQPCRTVLDTHFVIIAGQGQRWQIIEITVDVCDAARCHSTELVEKIQHELHTE